MEQQAKLFTVWNWLPAFYVVAQTEHLPTASRRLHLSVSALSRTIKLLESTLGYALFRRSGRNLVLNERGARWRAVVEKLVDGFGEDFARLGEEGGGRVVHVVIAGSLSQRLLAPAVVRALTRHEGVVPNLHGGSDADAIGLVAGGEAELALVRVAGAAPGVTVRAVGSLARSVYAHVDTPAADQPFIAHPGAEGAGRIIGVYVQQEDTALQLCLSGQGVTVLPDALAEPYVARRQLYRIADDASTPLYIAHRAAAAPLVAALERELRNLGARTADDGSRRWRMGDELALRGEYVAALGAYAAALEQWPRTKMPKSATVAYRLRRARLALLRGDHGAVGRGCAQARASRGATAAQRAEAEALAALSFGVRGDVAAAEARLQAARAIAEELPTDDADARRAWLALHRAEGNVRVAAGRPIEAIAAYETAGRVAEALDDRWERSIASFNLAEAYLHAGQLDRAAATLERAGAEKSEIGDRWGLCHVQHARGLLLLLRGRAAGAVEEVARGLALAIDLDDGRLTAMLHVVGGRALLARDDPDGAARAFGFALRAAAGAKALAEGIQARIGLCDALLRRNAVAEAWRAAAEARRQSARLRSADARAAALVACAAVQRRRKQHAAAGRSWAAAAALVPSPTRLHGRWFTVEGAAIAAQ